MTQKRKHCETIKAWADGAVIQYYNGVHFEWCDVEGNFPLWEESTQYRVKPEDIVRYGTLNYNVETAACQTIVVPDNDADSYLRDLYSSKTSDSNIELTFDGQTGKLKKIDVLT